MTTPTFDQADFVIITALPKEAQAVSGCWKITAIPRPAKGHSHLSLWILAHRQDDQAYRVAVVTLPGMGELAAANATTMPSCAGIPTMC